LFSLQLLLSFCGSGRWFYVRQHSGSIHFTTYKLHGVPRVYSSTRPGLLQASEREAGSLKRLMSCPHIELCQVRAISHEADVDETMVRARHHQAETKRGHVNQGKKRSPPRSCSPLAKKIPLLLQKNMLRCSMGGFPVPDPTVQRCETIQGAPNT